MYKKVKKPTMKSEWRGQTGNKFRIYIVTVDGKEYVHHNKAHALTQYNAGVSVANIRNARIKNLNKK